MKTKSGRSPLITWGLFLLTACAVLIVFPLLQRGTFMDGLLYRTVAYNVAVQDQGFFSMKFTDTSMPEFCEQPPLYFFLLGQFMRVAGTGDFADRCFTLILLFAELALLRIIIPNRNNGRFLLLVFLFLSVPVICWAHVNEIIEPMVNVWMLISIWSMARYLKTGHFGWVFLFTAMLHLLFLTKGFQSCFIVLLPPLFFMFKKDFRQFAITSSAIVTLFVMPLAWLLTGVGRSWFECYYQSRLVLTMQDVGQTTTEHSEIIVRFFTELIIPIITIVTLCIVLYAKKYPLRVAFRKFRANGMAVTLLILSFCGSMPYALSLVQRGFYLIPAMICFLLSIVLGFGNLWFVMLVPIAKAATYRLTQVIVIVITVAAFAWGILHFRDYKRDAALLQDLEKMKPLIPKDQRIDLDPGLWNDFSLHAYLYMQTGSSLVTDSTLQYKIVTAGSSINDTRYTEAVNGTSEYTLLKRR